MSLDKAIQHGKEKRKPYRGAKAVDPSCRNHGSCDWSKRDRLHSREVAELDAKQQIKEIKDADISAGEVIRGKRQGS